MTDRFYRHGWHSWSPTGWLDPSVPRRPVPIPEYRMMGDDPRHGLDTGWGGAHLGAVERDSGVHLIGALDLDTRVDWVEGALSPSGHGEWFEATGSEPDVFAGYASALAERLGARVRDPGPVWCSWYAYYGAVTGQDIRKELDGLGNLPFAVVQIDDGWQAGIGDWEANAKFDHDMRVMADQIGSTGRTPGLWLAPFLANADSRLAASHPEFLLRNGDADPVAAAFNWGGPALALDVTNPDVVEYVAETCRRAVERWGFGYLKLDFLYAGALGRDGEQGYRMAVEAIRQAVGDECYLLACGAPIIPSIGVFDGIRVGPDVAPFWENVDRVVHLHDRAGPGAADAIANSVARLWLRDVIAVDPDVVYFRSRNNLLTADQRGLLIDLAQVCGFRAVSDPIDWLDSREREALEAFLTERPPVERRDRNRFTIAGRPVDFGPVVEERPW